MGPNYSVNFKKWDLVVKSMEITALDTGPGSGGLKTTRRKEKEGLGGQQEDHKTHG